MRKKQRWMDNADDLLLNPAHLLVGAKAANPDIAKSFVYSTVSPSGQLVIPSFKIMGSNLQWCSTIITPFH